MVRQWPAGDPGRRCVGEERSDKLIAIGDRVTEEYIQYEIGWIVPSEEP